MSTHVFPTHVQRPALLRTLVATTGTPVGTFLRLTLAVAMTPHALQKTTTLFGGGGVDASMGFLVETMGLPPIIGALVIAIEVAAPILLAFGLLTRAAALGVLAIMVGAVWTIHGAHGFMMNWTGSAAGEGYEYHLLAIAISLTLVAIGGGRFSLDRMLGDRMR